MFCRLFAAEFEAAAAPFAFDTSLCCFTVAPLQETTRPASLLGTDDWLMVELNQPFQKIRERRIGSFSQSSGVLKKKVVENQHLDKVLAIRWKSRFGQDSRSLTQRKRPPKSHATIVSDQIATEKKNSKRSSGRKNDQLGCIFIRKNVWKVGCQKVEDSIPWQQFVGPAWDCHLSKQPNKTDLHG